VGTISADTVSRMMRFLGIESNDNLVEQRLNKQRIEHQKTVPHQKKQFNSEDKLGTIKEDATLETAK